MTNIVMVVKDRLRLTQQALMSLRLSTVWDSYTLTLVDDASQDFRVMRLLDSQCEKYSNTRLVRIQWSDGVVSRAKNLGVYWSEQCFGRGDWLYLSDNDVYFRAGWLDWLVEGANVTEPDGFALWGGQVHPFHSPLRTQVNEMLRSSPIKDPFQVDEHGILDGPSWLMRWRTWDLCGPFDSNTAPGVCQSEEYPFCQRVQVRGGGLSKEDFRDSAFYLPGRIGVIHPHVVLHTGLTNSDGKDAPGRKEREAQMERGVIYE